MMIKKRSRKSVVCLAIACLMLAVVPLWEPQATDAYAEFSYYQYLDVSANGYWYAAIYNFQTGQWTYEGYFFRDDFIDFTIPYNAYKAIFLVDYNFGPWELMYLLDYILVNF